MTITSKKTSHVVAFKGRYLGSYANLADAEKVEHYMKTNHQNTTGVYIRDIYEKLVEEGKLPDSKKRGDND